MSSDPNGLLSLLEEHGGKLLALFTRLTLRANVAEDLLQDLFVKLQNNSGFVRAANRKAYLFRAAINLAFDWRRSLRPTESLPAEQLAVRESPLDHLMEVEEFDQVVRAMESLPEQSRQVMILRYLQQQEYTDIAKQLGKTPHQVRGLCHKAIGQLQHILRTAVHEPKKC